MVCPICNKFKGNKEDIINHAEKIHRNQLPDNISTYRYIYSLTNGRDYGLCIVCGRPTEWNENTQKPNRLCGRARCRETMRAAAKKNMDRVYGEGHYPVNDPEHQKLMLKNRRNTKEYKFKDRGVIDAASKDEYELLSFLENTFDMTSNDVIECPHTFTYDDKGVKRYYLPDFYLVNYNLIIEQKDAGNLNPQFLKETRYKVKLKAEAVKRDGRFNYIIVYGDDYEPLIKLLAEIRNKEGYSNANTMKNKNLPPLIIHNESVEYPGRFATSIYFGILWKDNKPQQFLITDNYSADIVYTGDESGLITIKSKDSLKGDLIMMYEIKELGDGNNQGIMDELKKPFQVSEDNTPDSFILYLLSQYNRPIYISNKCNNNETGDNTAVFSHQVELKMEEINHD